MCHSNEERKAQHRHSIVSNRKYPDIQRHTPPTPCLATKWHVSHDDTKGFTAAITSINDVSQRVQVEGEELLVGDSLDPALLLYTAIPVTLRRVVAACPCFDVSTAVAWTPH